jgi:hypothetical protein
VSSRDGDKRQRQNLVGVRLTDKEHALLVAVAGRAGMSAPAVLRAAFAAAHGRRRNTPRAPAPADRPARLRAAHAEMMRLERAGLPVPLRVRALDSEYKTFLQRRKRARARQAAAGERADAA